MKECPTTKVSGQGTGGLVLETFLHCERSFIFFNASYSDIMRLNGFLLWVKDPQYVTPRAVTSAEINVNVFLCRCSKCHSWKPWSPHLFLPWPVKGWSEIKRSLWICLGSALFCWVDGDLRNEMRSSCIPWKKKKNPGGYLKTWCQLGFSVLPTPRTAVENGTFNTSALTHIYEATLSSLKAPNWYLPRSAPSKHRNLRLMSVFSITAPLLESKQRRMSPSV